MTWHYFLLRIPPSEIIRNIQIYSSFEFVYTRNRYTISIYCFVFCHKYTCLQTKSGPTEMSHTGELLSIHGTAADWSSLDNRQRKTMADLVRSQIRGSVAAGGAIRAAAAVQPTSTSTREPGAKGKRERPLLLHISYILDSQISYLGIWLAIFWTI